MAPTLGDLHRAYDAARLGREVPSLAMASGAVLNQVLQTDAYDPNRTYSITKDGIRLIDVGTAEGAPQGG